MEMEMRRTICRLMLLSSLGTLLLFAEAAQASELCQFHEGGTSVLTYCEEGCCSGQCCSPGSDQLSLHTTILIIVCVVAGVVIIALLIISLVCVCKDKKKDKEADLAETGTYTGPTAGILLQRYNSRQLRLSQTLQQETVSVSSHQSDQTPQARRPSGIRRLSSGRPSDVSLHKEDIDKLSLAASNAHLSGRRHSGTTILVQERESAHEEDSTKGSHSPQSQSESTSLPSDGRERASHESEHRELSGSDGNSRVKPLSNPLLFVRRKSTPAVTHSHEQSPDDGKNPRKNSSHRRSGSDPLFVEQLESEGGLTSAPVRPSIPHGRRARHGSSKVFSQEDEEFFQCHSGSKRFTQTRHSDGFLNTRDEIPLSSILRPLTAPKKKFASVHFEQEQC